MKKNIYTIIVIILLYSCIEKEKVKLNCDAFDYQNGILIFSTIKIDSCVKIIRYQKNDIYKVIDTTFVKVKDYTKYEKNKYSIDPSFMNTGFDYQVIVNDSLMYFFTDIKTTLSTHGSDFMHGEIEMCDIVSYKLNNILIKDKGLRINSAVEQGIVNKK